MDVSQSLYVRSWKLSKNMWSPSFGYLKFKSGCNGVRTYHHLVNQQTLNHLVKLASLAKWLSVRLRTKWLWVRIPLQVLKPQL